MNEGLDPTLGAILPLVGVVIGVLLNVVITAVAERRGHAREAKVAARLVAEDLMLFVSASDVVLGTRLWEALTHREEYPPAGWKEHRVTLAGALRRQEWRMLRIAVRRMEKVTSAAKHASGAVREEDIPFIEGARDYAYQSFRMLDHVADIGLHSWRRRRPSSDEVRSGLFTKNPFSTTPVDDSDHRERDPPSQDG